MAILVELFQEMLQAGHGQAWRRALGHHAVAIGHEHGFAGSGETDVLAQPVLEDLEADRFHNGQVASGSYFVKTPFDPPEEAAAGVVSRLPKRV